MRYFPYVQGVLRSSFFTLFVLVVLVVFVLDCHRITIGPFRPPLMADADENMGKGLFEASTLFYALKELQFKSRRFSTP